MKDFDIAKYLREHQLGSYGILNHYVDLKPLNETTDDKLIFHTKDPISIEKISKELQAAGINFEKKVDDPRGYVKFYVKDVNDLARAKEAIKGKPGEIEYFKPGQYFKEEETEVEMNTEIPYEGPEHKLTGNGEGDEFEQAETVSEEEGDPKEDLAKTIEALKNMGYTSEEIRDLLRDLLYPDYSDESID